MVLRQEKCFNNIFRPNSSESREAEQLHSHREIEQNKFVQETLLECSKVKINFDQELL